LWGAVGTVKISYETPQAPHWVQFTNPDGTISKLAQPDTNYASTSVGTCSGVPEADRSDKPACVRTRTAKYIQTYNTSGAVIAGEYYNLTADPAENTNLLGDASTSNDPPPSTITSLEQQLTAFATCSGSLCVR
jgi:hypothetical protein